MESLMPNNNDSITSEIFTKWFIELKNLTYDIFPSFVCTVWNQPPEGILNIRTCWRYDLYAKTPIRAMELGYMFVSKSKEKNFKMTNTDCCELRNILNDLEV